MQKNLGPLGQIGYVVSDLKEAAMEWVDKTGIGPWYIAEHVPLDYFRHRGIQSEIEIGIATAFTGSLEIELILEEASLTAIIIKSSNISLSDVSDSSIDILVTLKSPFISTFSEPEAAIPSQLRALISF